MPVISRQDDTCTCEQVDDLRPRGLSFSSRVRIPLSSVLGCGWPLTLPTHYVEQIRCDIELPGRRARECEKGKPWETPHVKSFSSPPLADIYLNETCDFCAVERALIL